MDGREVGEATPVGNNIIENYYDFEWYGYDLKGKPLPYGIYIMRIYSDSGEIIRNEAFAVVK